MCRTSTTASTVVVVLADGLVAIQSDLELEGRRQAPVSVLEAKRDAR